MAKKTDVIVTERIYMKNLKWIAYMPSKKVLAQAGETESEAIGKLWLASAGDMIALFLDLAVEQAHKQIGEI